MKKNLYFCFILAYFMAVGCGSDETLELSTDRFESVSFERATYAVTIESDVTWTATSNQSWCMLSKQTGNSGETITLTVEHNRTGSSREAIVTITGKKRTEKIQLTQAAFGGDASKYTFNLPVVFQVLYQDKSDALQYVDSNKLNQILEQVNAMYADASVSTNMNINFVLAATDPQGRIMEHPGINYMQWPDSYPIDCDDFMHNDSGSYTQYIWDPNQFINIVVYNFKEENRSILGISQLPYCVKGEHELEGLLGLDFSQVYFSELMFPYCVSINSLYINLLPSSSVDNDDMSITLAHELGHYLGLLHTFSETESGDLSDQCYDSDYCADTPSYNREVYVTWASKLWEAGERDFRKLATRINCFTDETFVGDNIMDYDICYSNRFTPQQRLRTRHVLQYSPLMPGLQQDSGTTRSVSDTPIDLPIRTVKCRWLNR